MLTARTEAGLIEVEDRIHAAGGSATIAPLDLRDFDAIDRLAAALASRWSRLDIAVLNAAALGTLTPLPHTDVAEFDKVVALNLTANFRLIRAFDPLLRAAPAGRLLALTSSVAVQPRPYWGVYAATKAALENMVQGYGAEVANISALRVAVIDPGATRSSMRARAFPGEDTEMVKSPIVVGSTIVALLVNDFETGYRGRIDNQANRLSTN